MRTKIITCRQQAGPDDKVATLSTGVTPWDPEAGGASMARPQTKTTIPDTAPGPRVGLLEQFKARGTVGFVVFLPLSSLEEGRSHFL